MGVPTISSVLVLVGAATEQPWVVDGSVTVRRIVDLTVQIDHNVVDGAPASRLMIPPEAKAIFASAW